MNSGCYGYEISESILSVDVIKLNGEPKTFTRNQIEFFYRGSHFGERVIIIMSN